MGAIRTRPGMRTPAMSRPFVISARRSDGNELHIEDECLVWADIGACSLSAIAELRGDDELPLIAFAHQLQRLDPAGNKPARGKARGLSRWRLVEHMPVDRPALVGHGHYIRRSAYLFAVTDGDDLVLKPAGGRDHSG